MTEAKSLRVLVTAGGTREPIDGVRCLTNLSNGSFGRALSLDAAARGHRVTLLAPSTLPRLAGALPDEVDHRVFRTTAELARELERAAREDLWDLVFHAAAVSDYRPAEPFEGKLSSEPEERVLRLVKNPKIIARLREWFGRAFLVGFKLSVGSEPEGRLRAARDQISRNRSNLCVENDLSDFAPGEHSARMVTPEGGAIVVPKGSKASVARAVLDFVERRYNVHWYRTELDPGLPALPESGLPGRLLALAQASGALIDHDGNVSTRMDNQLLAVTPRGVDKSTLQARDMLVVRVDHHARTVHVAGERRASIDASVASALYLRLPALWGIVHTHDPWYLDAVETGFPFPCGVREEAEELLATLARARPPTHGCILLGMLHHGALLGLCAPLTLDQLEAQWTAVYSDARAHFEELGLSEEGLSGGRLRVVLAPQGLVGFVFEHPDGTVSPRLHPDFRGTGLGRSLALRTRTLGRTVRTYARVRGLGLLVPHGLLAHRRRRPLHAPQSGLSPSERIA